MKTVYLNMKYNNQVETVDEFTQGDGAPSNSKEFRKYVNDMIREYYLSGINVYKSNRACKEWREK